MSKRIFLKSFVIALIIGVISVTAIITLSALNAPRAEELREVYIPQDNPSVIIGKFGSLEKQILSSKELPKIFKSDSGEIHLGEEFSSTTLSPNGKKVAFTVMGTHDWAGVLNLQTQELRQLAFWYGGEIKRLYWAPNSKYLAVEGLPPHGRYIVEVFNVMDGEKFIINNVLTQWRDVEVYNPKWSQDSTKIFFTARHIVDAITEKRGEETEWAVNVYGTYLSQIK